MICMLQMLVTILIVVRDLLAILEFLGQALRIRIIIIIIQNRKLVPFCSVVSSSMHIRITILRCRCVNNNMVSLHEYGTFNFKFICQRQGARAMQDEDPQKLST